MKDAYLCSKTDWATGQIGVRAAVSYARIALALTEDIPRKPSRALRVVKRKCIYNSVQRLIKAGLLRSESLADEEQRRLQLRRVFWLALLRADDSTSNPDSRQMAGLIIQLSRHKAFSHNGLNETNTDQSSTSCPTDGTYKGICIPNVKSTPFRLTLTWQYDQNLVELFLQAAGFTSAQIKHVWFGKYVQHWSQQTITRTQTEWSTHFANHMQSYLLRPDFFEQVNGMLEYNLSPTKRKGKNKTQHSSSKGLTVPNIHDGSQLQTWAVAHGLPESPVGVDTAGYYRFLCQQVERMNLGKARN